MFVDTRGNRTMEGIKARAGPLDKRCRCAAVLQSELFADGGCGRAVSTSHSNIHRYNCTHQGKVLAWSYQYSYSYFISFTEWK